MLTDPRRRVYTNLTRPVIEAIDARGRRVVSERTCRRSAVILATLRRGLPLVTDAEIEQASRDTTGRMREPNPSPRPVAAPEIAS